MTQQNSNYGGAMALVTSLFFFWGFMTVMNDILIPHLQNIFDLTYGQSQLVNLSFFGAYAIGSLIYFLISQATGDPINKIGYKNGIIVGLLLSAAGSAIFFPATFINEFWVYLTGLFVLGLGFTVLQIAANPYVAILGAPETASSRLNMSQGFNSLGTMVGPLAGGAMIFTFFAGPDAVKYPYLILALFLVILAVVFKFVDLPSYTTESSASEDKNESGSAFSFPHLRYGMGAIFFYVGAEVAVGSFLIQYFEIPAIAGMSEEVAKNFVSLYWGGAMLGRFTGFVALSNIPNYWKKIGLMLAVAAGAFGLTAAFNYEVNSLPLLIFAGINFIGFLLGKSMAGRTLAIFALVAAGLLITTVNTTGEVAFWSVIAIGMFNSIMWPNIFTLSIDGLGKHTSQGSSLLVMMILGGAIIPPIQGYLADSMATATDASAGVQTSFYVPAICYLYIAFFGLYGSKAGKTTTA